MGQYALNLFHNQPKQYYLLNLATKKKEAIKYYLFGCCMYKLIILLTAMVDYNFVSN